MNPVVATILIAVGALLLTPLVFAAVLMATERSVSIAVVAPEALIFLVLVPITGLALIWAGLRGLKPR